MSDITLADLRLMVRQRADQKNSKFVEDDELNLYINQSLAELYELLVNVYNDRFVSTENFSITNGYTHTLPTDFFDLLGVDYLTGSGKYAEVYLGTFQQRNMWATSFPYSRVYQLRGNNIEIYPQDNALGTYRMHYVPRFVDLTDSTGSAIVSPDLNHWSEYAIVDAAIKCANKEESYELAAVLSNQKMALEKRIRDSATHRNIGEPYKMVDKRSRTWEGRGTRWGWGW